ncbi:MAG TPA: hypothetical protein VFA86_01525 [Gammaproteobacteria bacterium]|nr:hypothetical protein [Gammaproteobacteria bacterium]
MSGALRRFLVVDQSIVGFVINFLINAVIAWYFFRAMAEVPLTGGSQNILGDIIGTFFLLPLIACVIVTPLVRRQVRSGKLAAFHWDRSTHRIYRLLPRSSFFRGVVLGIVCTIVLGLPLFGIFQAAGLHALGYWRFVFVKGIYAGLLAALIIPVMAYAALGDARPVEQQATA